RRCGWECWSGSARQEQRAQCERGVSPRCSWSVLSHGPLRLPAAPQGASGAGSLQFPEASGLSEAEPRVLSILILGMRLRLRCRLVKAAECATWSMLWRNPTPEDFAAAHALGLRSC